MSGIVICSQCGFQTEADKKFCPNCGAPIESPGHQSYTHAPPSTKRVAASTLFSRLKEKKETSPNNDVDASSASVKPVPTVKSVLSVSEKKLRPKTFKKKPLGVSQQTARKSTKTSAAITKPIKDQLIGFLRELNKLDRTLEASAVVKSDGTLLASAHSSRAKPEMMATISSTLYGIAKDSIRAISGGKMRMVTITAEHTVLMLTAINIDTMLLLVTSPKSNLGLISMYSELVGQNIDKFLSKMV